MPAADKDLLGSRILAVDGHPIGAVLAAIRSTVDYEDPGVALGEETYYLQDPGWLHDLGLVGSVRSVVFTVRLPSGRVASAGIDSYGPGGSQAASQGEVTVPLPLYLQRQGQPYWLAVLARQQAVYLKYNKCLSSDGFQKLAARALALLRTHPDYRLIVDLRYNGGATSEPFQALIKGIRADPAIDRRGRVFGLINGAVYSSADLDATLLKLDTRAVLIGQQAAEQRDTYGDDSGVLKLPHYGVTIQYTTAVVNKRRLVMGIPDIYVAPTLRDWLSGTDPVLAVALAYTAR